MQINNLFLAEIFGIIAGILTSIRLIPQVFKSYKTKQTRDLSLYFLIILFFQALFLIFYGIFKPDTLIVYMNILPFFCSIILIKLKLNHNS
ncbi:MAG: SemiSWEET family transporter [bacterium]|nr:SemiSWEET family transporter [bacterium]